QAVGDEAVDLLADAQGLHAERGVEGEGAVDRGGGGGGAGADFHERKGIDRGEGGADDEAGGGGQGALEFGGERAGGGGGKQGVGRGVGIDLSEEALLEGENFGSAFLDEGGAGDGFGEGCGDGEAAWDGGDEAELRVGALGVAAHFGEVARGVGVGV